MPRRGAERRKNEIRKVLLAVDGEWLPMPAIAEHVRLPLVETEKRLDQLREEGEVESRTCNPYGIEWRADPYWCSFWKALRDAQEAR